MHTLHTTKAFVLQKFPQGESNYTYKLLTEDLGLLYAHAQGVRELKSRNRYALRVGHLTEVTLVKGREVWRVTTARNISHAVLPPDFKRKILTLAGKLSPVEVVSQDIFKILETCYTNTNKEKEIVEVLTLLRFTDKLGYVARPLKEHFMEDFLTSATLDEVTLEKAKKHKAKLILRVNSALEEAG